MRRAAFAAVTLLWMSIAVAAVAQPQVEIRHDPIERTDSGAFIRSNDALSIDVEERCSPACGDGEDCQIVCGDAACKPGADPVARCRECRWTCVP
jgi:hypothetical protein